MKTAPIQLSQLSFRRVSVELDASRVQEDGSPPSDLAFDFEGVIIQTHVGYSPVEESKEPGSSFFLTLRVVIDNRSGENDSVRFCPYLIDIEAGGVIRAVPGAEALGDIEDLIVVNGTSMLWSAIREQVCNLTARMPAGQVLLPTVHFQDLKKQHRQAAKADSEPVAKPRKAVRAESPKLVK
ncbi:MAG: hypothetical protein JSR26_10850 [Proteobacteria bacterium]|nr:hypothetical protein [Pseudomonadota bacterium]